MIKGSKKTICLTLFFSILSGLNAWSHFSVKNDTKKTIEIISSKGTTKIRPRKRINIVNYSYSKNPHMDFKDKIVSKKNENEFKISEIVSTDPKRTFLIAPIVVVGKEAHSVMLKASAIFTNTKLPNGYNYKTYSTGAKIKTKKSKMATPKFFIENDTQYKVNILSTDNKKRFEVKVPTITEQNLYIVNSVMYQNFKPKDGMLFATRYKLVNNKNIMRIEVIMNGKKQLFNIKINPELKEDTILKISNLIGFKITLTK